MCVAVPVQVLAVDEMTARVMRNGEEIEIGLLLLDEEVRPGDYLVLQAGHIAVARMDPAEAEARLALFAELCAALAPDKREAAE